MKIKCLISGNFTLFLIFIVGLAVGIFSDLQKTDQYGTTVLVRQFYGDTFTESAGFFIGDNKILTVAHGLSDLASKLYIVMDGQEYSAEKTAYYWADDVALLRLTTDGSYPYFSFWKRLPTIGETVYTNGLPNTVTLDRLTLDIDNRHYENLIELETVSDTLASGTPVLDEYGKVVGMIVIKKTTEDHVYYMNPSSEILGSSIFLFEI
jgi:S1-C subfamily serine protease